MIIGIGDLGRDSKVARIAAPEKDAREFYSVITDQTSGVAKAENVALLINEAATNENILAAIHRLRAKMKATSPSNENDKGGPFIRSRDTLILYFSGYSSHDLNTNDLILATYGTPAENHWYIAMSVEKELIPTAYSPNAYLVFIGDGCHIGEQLITELGTQYPNLAVLGSTKEDDLAYDTIGSRGSFTHNLVQALTSPEADLDEDGFISVEEAYNYLYPAVVTATKLSGMPQYPSVSGRYIHRIALAKTPRDSIDIAFDSSIPPELQNAHELLVNGRPVTVETHIDEAAHTLRFLGQFSGKLGKGVNYFEAAKQRFIFWQEERKLKAFRFPYKHSFAVLVAIDDYDRVKDPLHRGKTGFPQLSYMTVQAGLLKQALMNSGFAEKDILELYNDKASSATIDEVLKSFWKGGIREDVDRLFFYFGGHGGSLQKEGFLVTYDFNSNRPTSTSLLMSDLTRRYAENSMAHHFLIALDACNSGLAVYKALAEPMSAERLRDFNALAVIRNDVEQPARNVLVAGTDEQTALWDNGGIFTKALVDGINGAADYNQDGLIQFPELAVYVRNRVAEVAAAVGVRQTVGDYKLTQMGGGQFMFFKRP